MAKVMISFPDGLLRQLAALDTGDRFHQTSDALVELADRDGVSLAALDLTGYETANLAVTKWRDAAAAVAPAKLIDAYCVGKVAIIVSIAINRKPRSRPWQH